jgi:glycosyltransferase involved in cell wall biosynthesis
MRIGVDFLADRLGQSGCIGFHRNFIHWISRLAKEEKYYIFVYDPEYHDYQRYLSDGQKAVKLISWGSGKGSLWKRLFDQQLLIPYHYKKIGIDRGFSDNIIPFFGSSSIKWAYRVLITQQFRREFDDNRVRTAYRRIATRYACWRASHIIPNSHYTCQEIQKFLSVPAHKLILVGDAVDHEMFYPIKDKLRIYRELQERFDVIPPYVLQVSGYYDHKNPQLSIKVLKWLRQRNVHINFVLVGADPLGNADKYKRLASQLGISEYVKFVSFQIPEVLRLLYNGATCFVYPSTSETFGIPPLEAMACGIPVVASNASAVPEVVDNAGLIVNPFDMESFGEAVYSVVSHEAFRNELIEKGLRHVKRFKWENVISQLRLIILSE